MIHFRNFPDHKLSIQEYTVMLRGGKMPLKAQLIGGLVVPLVQFLTPAAGGVVQLMKPLHKC